MWDRFPQFNMRDLLGRDVGSVFTVGYIIFSLSLPHLQRKDIRTDISYLNRKSIPSEPEMHYVYRIYVRSNRLQTQRSRLQSISSPCWIQSLHSMSPTSHITNYHINNNVRGQNAHCLSTSTRWWTHFHGHLFNTSKHTSDTHANSRDILSVPAHCGI